MSLYLETKTCTVELGHDKHEFAFREPDLTEVRSLINRFTQDERVKALGGVYKFLEILDQVSKSDIDMNDPVAVQAAFGDDMDIGAIIDIAMDWMDGNRTIAAKCLVGAPEKFDDPIVYFARLSGKVKLELSAAFQELFPLGEYMSTLRNSPSSTT